MQKWLIINMSSIILMSMASSVANAHIIPWRAGETRQIGWGHCAKGACTKRTVWAENKPHRHVGKKIVLVKIASPGDLNGRQ